MYKRIVLFFMFLGFAFGAFAQETDTTKVEEPAEVPVISYSSPPKKYKIADIKVTGIKNYDDFVLIGFSGLSVGDEVTIPEPGGAITDAVKRFWKHGLFSEYFFIIRPIVHWTMGHSSFYLRNFLNVFYLPVNRLDSMFF